MYTGRVCAFSSHSDQIQHELTGQLSSSHDTDSVATYGTMKVTMQSNSLLATAHSAPRDHVHSTSPSSFSLRQFSWKACRSASQTLRDHRPHCNQTTTRVGSKLSLRHTIRSHGATDMFLLRRSHGTERERFVGCIHTKKHPCAFRAEKKHPCAFRAEPTHANLSQREQEGTRK